MASGVLVQGPYLVTSIQDANTYEITLQTPADGSNSVALPIITATALSSFFNVNLPGHGRSAGQTFYVNVPTTVGGAQLSGGFTITAVPDFNNFTIQGPQPAISNQVVTMNGGLAQAQTQVYNQNPIDYILYPISRTDYASQPEKSGPLFRPTTFWFNRQIQPTIQFWNPPDNQCYILNLWVMVQPEDATVGGGVGVGVPYRWYETFSSGLALKLARKFPPQPPNSIADMRSEYQNALADALREDIERVPLYIGGSMQSYFR